MRIGRKLEDINRDLATLGEQGKTKGFFNNVENAEKLSGLVEDVRDAMMDYQVRSPIASFSRAYVPCRHRYNGTYTTRVSYSSLVSYYHPSLSDSVTDQQTGVSGPCPSGQDVPHSGCRILVWEQAGVSERNPKGCPVGNRALVHRRTGTARLLVEWARWNGEINHRPNGGRGSIRGRKTRGELLLLTRLR